jgi:hypothetical protein
VLLGRLPNVDGLTTENVRVEPSAMVRQRKHTVYTFALSPLSGGLAGGICAEPSGGSNAWCRGQHHV